MREKVRRYFDLFCTFSLNKWLDYYLDKNPFDMVLSVGQIHFSNYGQIKISQKPEHNYKRVK
jgi:hypothetical protein